MARAVTVPALDAHVDLQFSLDGATWADAPGLVLGSWGCDFAGGPVISDPGGAIGGTADVDPCSMSPGESIDRTYHVRNATNTGRTGRYAVGVGDYVVSDHAEFTVSSTIAGQGTEAHTVNLFGPATTGAGGSAERGSTVAMLNLAPGQSAKVVDEVSVPRDADQTTQRQSVSPLMWVSFSDIGIVDTDGDGLPDRDEDELGTDPTDPFNTLPNGTTGTAYGPELFLPTSEPGTDLEVDVSTLPPGMRLEDGALVGIPTRAGVYDIAFTVTMPGGATYTSVRRVTVEAAGGGSVDLPDLFWPIVIIGIIGGGIGSVGHVIGGSLGNALGSGGSLGSLSWDSLTGPGGPLGNLALESVTGPNGSHGSAASSNSAMFSPATSLLTPSQSPTPMPSQTSTSTAPSDRGQIPAAVVTPHDGAPPSEWARANSHVRGSLAETGVSVADMLLWAFTSLAAGITLMLLISRRTDSSDTPD